jgi:asparagine synthase (glutamine-hydrolysing)
LFDEMIAHSHEPVGNATALAQLFLAKQTKPTATVVLSGEGGDELFGGYERYRMALIAGRMARLFPKALSSILPARAQKGLLSGVDRYAQLMYQKDSEVAPLLVEALPDTNALFKNYFGKVSDVVALMRADEENWLVDEALLRADAMSMAASVESRVPFLDNDVRAIAHALPLGYKVTTTATKRILKHAFKDVLPKEVLHAPKRGWFSPGAKWLRRPEFVALAAEVFAPGYTELSQLFDSPALDRMWQEHKTRKAYHFTELWAVMVVLAWAKRYKVTL